jgi:hypothetical protein
MRAQDLFKSWSDFLFRPQSPVPVSIYRIFFGALVLWYALVLINQDVLFWYGPHGVVSSYSIRRFWAYTDPRFNLLLLFPNSDFGVMMFWYLYLAAALCLTMGLFTRYSALIVSLCLITMHNDQPYNINGGDAMLRLCSMCLIFADSGGALSLDRLIKRYTRPTFGQESRPKPSAPLGQRMIQIETAIAYWHTSLCKAAGPMWLDGTAAYYSVRLQDMSKFAFTLPWLYNNVLFCKLLSWYTLVIEFAMWSLVWFKDLRYFILLGAIILHLGIDYSMSLPGFEWAFMATFINFVDPLDLSKCMDYIKTRVRNAFGEPIQLFYNPASEAHKGLASVIEGLDVFGRLTISSVNKNFRQTSLLFAETERGTITGLPLLALLSSILPLLWPLCPVLIWFYMGKARRIPRQSII